MDFKRRRKPFSAVDKCKYAELLERASTAIARRDIRAVGRVATRSAELVQRFNPKRTLDEVIALSREIGALGVAVAHSGTCVGIMVERGGGLHERQVEVATAALRRITNSVFTCVTCGH